MKKLLLVFILFSCGVLRSDDTKVKFSFNRYFAKDQVYFAKIKYAQFNNNKSYASGALIDESNNKGEINYTARVLVTGVNQRSLSVSEVHEIHEANQTVGTHYTKLFDKGDSLLISNEENGKSIKMHGKEIDKKLFSSISGFLEMNLGGPTYDDMFHDGKAHAGGESWDINKEVIIGSFKDQKIEISPESLEGSVKMIQEEKSFRLVGEFQIKAFPFMKNSSKDSEYLYKVESFLYDKLSLLPYKNIKTTVQKVVIGEGEDKKIITVTKVVTTEYFSDLQKVTNK